jgi:hypothetical protein
MKYLILLLAPLVAMSAEPKAKKYTLNDLEWGKVVAGPALTDMFIKDKGMVILYFTSNKEMDPESVLGRLKTQVTEADGKILAVAVESNGSMSLKEVAALVKFTKSCDIDFSVAVGMRKRPPGFARIIPYCYVLNSKKVIIYSGPFGGSDFNEAMKEAATPAANPSDKSKDSKKDEKPKVDPKKAA